MSIPATARHRASLRPSTPLSTLAGAVSDGAGSLGRGGVVIAMSSGLVATLGLPAHADGKAAAPDSGPATAQLAALSLTPEAGTAPVVAPETATLVFERGAFSAAPKATAKGTKTRPRAMTRIAPRSGGDRSGHRTDRAPFGSSRGQSVLSVAAQYLGVPYRFGGDTPAGWDCSGAMRYIFGQVGVALPRSSAAQYAATHRISRDEARPGDMVFFFSGGRVYHAALYAGGGMVYDAGRSGSRFSKRPIWSSNVAFTRVTG